ncbi:MAG: cell division protein FtsA, partial [Lachnospiraceae bacterium]
TRDGSIVAYGMIPFAGDELTEAVAKACLVDFNTAERIKTEMGLGKEEMEYKDIMFLPQKITAKDFMDIVRPVMDTAARAVADKIKELNGGKAVNAVFVVGGGGKILGYTDLVAKYLGIAGERVAVRGEEVLTGVDFEVEDVKKDSLFVTPVGICTNYYAQKNNFMFVNVNGQRVKLYDNSHLTVVDAIMQVGFPNEDLFPKRGRELQFTVNGKPRMVRGSAGEGAVIKLNGNVTNLNATIQQNDIVEITESTEGAMAECTIGQLEEFKSSIEFTVNGKNVLCPRFAYVNGALNSEFYQIKDGDAIVMENFYTVAQLFEFLDVPMESFDITVNNEPANENTKVYENFTVVFEPIKYVEENLADKIIEGPVVAHRRVVPEDENGSPANNTEADVENPQGVTEDEPPKEIHDIAVIINGAPVILKGKAEYVVVDIFTVYDFDTSVPKGDLVFKVNDKNAEYMAPLNQGDVIELRWSND